MPLASINDSMFENARVKDGGNVDDAGNRRDRRNDGRESVDHELVDSLKEEHVVVDFATMHFGMKHLNPMLFMKFYGKHNINSKRLALV